MSLSKLPPFTTHLQEIFFNSSSKPTSPIEERIEHISEEIVLYRAPSLKIDINRFCIINIPLFFSENLLPSITALFNSNCVCCCPPPFPSPFLLIKNLLPQIEETKEPSIEWRSQDFFINKVLGTGSFSTIYQSLHTPSGNHFAIKEIDILKLKSIDKVTSSALLSFQLYHPFFVQNYTFLNFKNQELNQKKYILMEHLSGVELFNYLSNRTPFTLNETQFIITSLLSLMKYLHERSIVHRDLKLENMFLTVEGYLKVFDIDFMKCLIDSNGRTSTFCGSPDYAAPELILNKKSYKGSCVDMWAIGVITYICLLKRMPFEKVTTINKLFQDIIHSEPNYHYFEFAGLEGSLAQHFIQQLLLKSPSKRMNVDEALAHPFLEGFNSDDIESQREPSPFLITADLPYFVEKP